MSSLLNIGTRAMSAAYAQLTTTGNNIANSSVTGYSRQQTLLSTTPGQFTGSGFFGKGVDVSSVTRSHDDYLTSLEVDTEDLKLCIGRDLRWRHRGEISLNETSTSLNDERGGGDDAA